MEWIDVNDKVPNHGERVICAYRFGVGEARFSSFDNLFYRTCDKGMFEIDFPFTSHWMPLPQNPNNTA